MSNKPDKYGLKFWLGVDMTTKYVCNAFPYLGKEDMHREKQRLGEYIVLHLMEPFVNQGRNVTTDSFLTSLQLAKKLKEKETSLFGTMNKIRREIPDTVRKSNAEIHYSILHNSGNPECTMTVTKERRIKSHSSEHTTF